MVFSRSFEDMHICRMTKNLSCSCKSQVKKGKALLSCVSSHTTNNVIVTVYLVTFSVFLYILLIILPFTVSSKYSADVLSHFPKLKKSVMCLIEKLHM